MLQSNVTKQDDKSQQEQQSQIKEKSTLKKSEENGGLRVTVFPCGKEDGQNKEPYELVLKGKLNLTILIIKAMKRI